MRSMRTARLAALAALVTILYAGCASAPAPDAAARLRQPSAWSGDPTVTTRFGLVRAESAPSDTWLWRAIPYAAPPIGELRWRAPRDPAPWSGVRAERAFNGGCTQYNPLLRGAIRGSEDCLYLNVWRPRDAAASLPVYVWIHGGGNSMGSATLVADYYGDRIASRSRLVFVSINYRLGPFGWFTNPALREGESPVDASGNYGTLDIIKALEWVRDDIAAFGGNPDDVTIAGESAGAMDVLSLLLSPRAHGLFQRAIVESGAPVSSSIAAGDAKSKEVIAKLLVADRTAADVEEAVRVENAMQPARLAAYLRSKSDREILRTYGGAMLGMVENPNIFTDGFVIPASGYAAFDDGSYPNKVPLVIGTNREEVKLFLLFGKLKWRDPLYAAVAKYGSERWKASGVDEIAHKLSALPGQPPVYAYEFAWGAPDAAGTSVMPGNWGARLGSFHSLEIPFFLGTSTVDGFLQNFLFTSANAPGRRALSNAIMAYLASFARTGDPNQNGSGLPEWRAWSNAPGAETYLVLDAGLTDLRVTMARGELTKQSVLEALNRELPEPLRSETRAFLDKSRTP